MDSYSEQPTSLLLITVLENMQWEKASFGKIRAEQPASLDIQPITRHKMEKYLSYYFIEIINFPGDDKMEAFLYNKLVSMISENTHIPEGKVKRCLYMASSEVKSQHIATNSEIKISTSSPTETTISVGPLNFPIPTTTYNYLLEALSRYMTEDQSHISKDEHIARLCLRYKPIGRDTGFFWSMDKRVYNHLISTSTLPALEGFASPFNNNLRLLGDDESNNKHLGFCSAFASDNIFGSNGSFFKYLPSLNIAARVIANPPYTGEVMTLTAKTCIDYVERVKGGECILMYPHWDDHESVILLKEYKGCEWKVYSDKEYTIHDFSKDMVIMTPMPLIFFILHAPDTQATISVEEIDEQIRLALQDTRANQAIIKEVRM